jgi:hypothetical protein
MIFVCDSPEQADVITRLLAGARFRLGEQAPPWLADVRYAVINDHSGSLAITPVDKRAVDRDDAPVTYSEAAAVARVSVSTIRRRVAAGDLVQVGRRVSAASLRKWMVGGG